MLRSRSFPAFILLVASWLAAAYAVGLHGDFPLNDDWQYAYPVKQWVEQGQLHIKGYFSPNILTQVYWGALFCELAGSFSFEHLRLSTWVAAGIGGWGIFSLLRQLGSSTTTALLGTAAVLFSPLYFHLSFSFMTDVPFLATVIWACWAGLRFQAVRHSKWLLLFVLLTLAAYFNRQPGVLLLPAMGGWYVLHQSGRARAWAWALFSLVAAVSAYLALEKGIKPWLGISDNYLPVSGQLLDRLVSEPLPAFGQLARRGVKTWVYLGCFCLPLLPFLWGRLRKIGVFRPLPLVGVLLANIALLLVQFSAGHIFPYGGNIFFNWGLGPELLADVYTFGLDNTPGLPLWAMQLLGLASQLVATWLTWLGIRGWKQLTAQQRNFFTFLFLLNLGNFLVIAVTGFFDRYVLVSVVSTLLFFSLFVDQPAPLPTYSILLAFALFSTLATHDYLAWNRARADAYQWLQGRGVSIQQVDAGYEYNGWYNYHREREGHPNRSWWWVTSDEWMITFGPRPGYRQQAAFPYRRWLWGGRVDAVWVLHREP